MNLKDSIEKIYAINTDYAYPEHAVQQAESLSYLSDDLYTDSKRFIYELIQNADDAYSKEEPLKIWITLKGEWLIIAHTGKPFSDRDVRGLCGVNDSAKKRDVDKTGYKGIGFKAVFSKSDFVIVHSSESNFRFDKSYSHPWRTEWDSNQKQWENENERDFKFPWQLIPVWTSAEELPSEAKDFIVANSPRVATIIKLRNSENVKEGIEDLIHFPLMLLFLRNIQEIKFDLDKQISITKTYSEDTGLTKITSPKSATEWLIKSMIIDVPPNVVQQLSKEANVPPKLLSAERTTLTFAAKCSGESIAPLPDSESLLFSFLPTEARDYKFPVLVNSTFITNSNRQELHQDSAWNQWLFKHMSSEMLKWISELVFTFRNGAYVLIPERQQPTTKLAVKFNDGFETALRTVRFILNNNQDLLLPSEALMDFTGLSGQEFINSKIISGVVDKIKGGDKLHHNPFIDYVGVESKLGRIGVSSFDWPEFIGLLTSPEFLDDHSQQRNFSMIEYLFLRQKDDNRLKGSFHNAAFLLDHKGGLQKPGNIYLPTPDDTNWNSLDSEISYLHPEVQNSLQSRIDIRNWLSELGVIEKTDLSYLDKTIIPNASNFVTAENAVDVVRRLFGLFQNGEIGKDRLQKLGKLKLLTEKGNLISAQNAYLSDDYNPKLRLQSVLDEDIFVSKRYIFSNDRVADLRTFFTFIHACEEIEPILLEDRVSRNILRDFFSIHEAYFDVNEFTPFSTTFKVQEWKGLVSLTLLTFLKDVNYSREFWGYVVRNVNVDDINKPVIGYWGYGGRPGWETGDEIGNYLPWFIAHIPCLPTLDGKLEISSNIFLNSSAINELAGNYLPVIDLGELSPNWKAFFKFKTELSLSDYLTLLDRISKDTDERRGLIVPDNKGRIQNIYGALLKSFPNFSEKDQILIKERSSSLKFFSSSGDFKPAIELTHFADGEPSMFVELFEFINLSKENKKNANVDGLMTLFGIRILSVSNFTINKLNESESAEFKEKIRALIPFFAKWLVKYKIGEYEIISDDVTRKLESLRFSESDSIEIIHESKPIKRLNSFERGNEIGFTRPWSSGRVMLDLPSIIAKKLGHSGYDKEFEFLLRESTEEIRNYFLENEIESPEGYNTGIGPSDLAISIESNAMINPGIDYDGIRSEVDQENLVFLPADEHDPMRLLLHGTGRQNSKWKGHLYHFTHIENAIRILKDGLFKSRATAEFKDSASSGAIANTDTVKQRYVRYYFRPHTPTQYYNQNLGKGSVSVTRLGSDPVCPVPIFFVIPLEEVLKPEINWAISLGSMARKGIEFGCTENIIRQFDFNGVYLDPYSPRYFASSQQEFLILDQLKLAGLNFKLICQDQSSYQTLKTLLEGLPYQDFVSIDDSYYNNENDKVKIDFNDDCIAANLNVSKEGFLVAQIGQGSSYEAEGDITYTFETENRITLVSRQQIVIHTDFTKVQVSLYYAYNGELWLLHTNENDPVFNYAYLRSRYLSAASLDTLTGNSIVRVLSLDPKLRLLYNLGVGGPDGLTLSEHTVSVIDNYLSYFIDKFSLLLDKRYFILMLAIHDVGKPVAMMDGRKHDQHRYTLRLIDDLLSAITDDSTVKQTIISLIDGDPIGKYLDPRYNVSFEDTVIVVTTMAHRLKITPTDFWPTLIAYYQCDAGGYHSLRQNLFVHHNGEMLFDKDRKRLIFNEPHETKIQRLEKEVIQ